MLFWANVSVTRSQLKRSFKKLKIFCPAFGDLFWGVGGVRGGGGWRLGFLFVWVLQGESWVLWVFLLLGGLGRSQIPLQEEGFQIKSDTSLSRCSGILISLASFYLKSIRSNTKAKETKVSPSINEPEQKPTKSKRFSTTIFSGDWSKMCNTWLLK